MRYQTLTVAAASLLLLLLLQVAGTAHASAEEHGCAFDELVRKQRAATDVNPIVTELDAPPAGAAAAVAKNGHLQVFSVGSSAGGSWYPLRIGVYTEDLYNDSQHCTAEGQTRPNLMGTTSYCWGGGVFTPEKKELLLSTVLPAAVQLHEERLQVQRVAGFKVPKFTKGICSYHTVPASHHTEGVADVDFLLYVSAAPQRSNEHAWAMTCASHSSGRPAVGVLNVHPYYIADVRHRIRTVAHEIMHALGFNVANFKRADMIKAMPELRGKRKLAVVASPNVIQRAGNHYGCDTMPGMELEDIESTELDFSHWKRRNAKDELMGAHPGSAAYYTAISIAAMEDLGYYKGDYSKAEYMGWGFGVGCNLFNNKCMENGVSNFPSMFCTTLDPVCNAFGFSTCTSDHTGVSFCSKSPQAKPLPSQFQYFADPVCSGLVPEMDYCPFQFAYANAWCSDGNVSVLPGSVVSATSRCFDTPNGRAAGYSITAMCAQVVCDGESRRYGVKVKGATVPVDCPAGGSLNLNDLNPSIYANGRLVCPNYGVVCQDTFNSLSLNVKRDPRLDGATLTQRVTALSVMVALILIAFV